MLTSLLSFSLALAATISFATPVDTLKRDFTCPGGQNDGYPYPTVKFTNTWPAQFHTGDGNEAHMTWTGGSGRYDMFWLESWHDGQGAHNKQYYFFRNETFTQYSFYFSPSGCWHRGASILFGIQEGDVQAGSVTQRDHATSPLLELVRGPDDVYNSC